MVAVLLPVMTAGGVLALAVPGKRDKILRGLYVFAGTMGWMWLVYWVVRLARAIRFAGAWRMANATAATARPSFRARPATGLPTAPRPDTATR